MAIVLAVCGGRDFNYKATVFNALDAIHSETPIERLLTGGCRGADLQAEDWAEEHYVPIITFNADWGTNGRKAGPIRNQLILDDGKPDVLLAFPGGKGTEDMKRRARKAGIKIIDLSLKEEDATI